MKGLKNFTSWRTFLTGLIVGYLFAWGIHWSARLRDINGVWWDEEILIFTPHWGKG